MRAGAVDVLCAAPGLSYLLASVETDLNDKLHAEFALAAWRTTSQDGATGQISRDDASAELAHVEVRNAVIDTAKTPGSTPSGN